MLDPSGSAQVTELLLSSFWLIFENNLLEKALSLVEKLKNLAVSMTLPAIFRIGGRLQLLTIARLRTCALQWMYVAVGDDWRMMPWTPLTADDIFDAPSYPWPLQFLMSRPYDSILFKIELASTSPVIHSTCTKSTNSSRMLFDWPTKCKQGSAALCRIHLSPRRKGC